MGGPFVPARLSAGPMDVFTSTDRYREQVRAMLDTGVLRRVMIYA
ncbi:hypothetical protein ABZY68_35580 [Streptomyces sp. NPDC006482]